MHLYEVFISAPGIGTVGERILAQSEYAAAQAVLARYPGSTLSRVTRIH